MSPNNHCPKLTLAQIEAWNRQANRGDPHALAKLSELLASKARLLDRLDDRCQRAESLTAAAASHDHFDMTLAVRAQLDLLKAELASENDSQVERMLIERIAVCWGRLHLLEQEAASAFAREPAEYPDLDMAIDRAHRRYLKAIEALTRLRKVLRRATSA